MNFSLALLPVTMILTCIVTILFLIHLQLVKIRIEITKMRVQASINNDWIEIKSAEKMGKNIEDFYKKK